MKQTYNCADTTIINCLSDYYEGDCKWQEFVYYYSPEKLFGFAQELSRNVIPKHDLELTPEKVPPFDQVATSDD